MAKIGAEILALDLIPRRQGAAIGLAPRDEFGQGVPVVAKGVRRGAAFDFKVIEKSGDVWIVPLRGGALSWRGLGRRLGEFCRGLQFGAAAAFLDAAFFFGLRGSNSKPTVPSGLEMR